MRRAKIVCTLGPSTSSYDEIKELIRSGMNVARLNMSHGEHLVHAQSCANVRRAAKDLGVAVGVVADLQGPKIRLGRFATPDPVILENGAEFTITTEDIVGDVTRCGTTHKGLPIDCHVGDTVLVDDGKVKLEVIEVDGPRVRTRVVEGGPVSNNKGINLPGAEVSVPALSDKDRDDLAWALGIGVDFCFLSFVRSGSDVKEVHQIMDRFDRRIPVLAKVEKPQAVANLADIIDAFDGVMVARGDLGVELPLEEVPIVQKAAIQMCREAAKPVIVATQMLESMMSNSRPTRAEASDVANAISTAPTR
jgi:pyruvate kinase